LDVKTLKKQKKQSVNNAVLRERLKDVGIFKNEAGKAILKSFLAPLKPEKFFVDIFEKSHHVFKRKDESFARICRNMFNKERFEAIAKLESLEPVRDFNLMKYSEGVRVNHSAMEHWPDVDVPKDFSSYANVMQLVNDQHYTMQFHQPQRFCDDFWRVMAALEEAFGALVGANIYWTPKSTQGLAPHWDSIDAFVLQLNGTKKWKLWKNPEMELPPGAASVDLNPEELGEPTAEVELAPGDLLYMPRGLVHCAVSGEEESSIHATFSVNENQSAANWLSVNFNSLLDRLAEEQRFLRESLPRNFRNQEARTTWAKSTLTKIAGLISDEMLPEEDPIRKDFMANRLPPYKQPQHASKLKQIDLNCKVRLRTKEHIYIYEDDHVGQDEAEDDFGAQLGMDDGLDEDDSDEEATNGEEKESGIEDDRSADGEQDEEEDDDEEEEDKVFVMHSVQNERRDHMVTQSLPKCIKFPVAFKPSLEKLMSLGDAEYVMLSDLELPATEAVQFAVALWAEGLITATEI